MHRMAGADVYIGISNFKKIGNMSPILFINEDCFSIPGAKLKKKKKMAFTPI